MCNVFENAIVLRFCSRKRVGHCVTAAVRTRIDGGGGGARLEILCFHQRRWWGRPPNRSRLTSVIAVLAALVRTDVEKFCTRNRTRKCSDNAYNIIRASGRRHVCRDKIRCGQRFAHESIIRIFSPCTCHGRNARLKTTKPMKNSGRLYSFPTRIREFPRKTFKPVHYNTQGQLATVESWWSPPTVRRGPWGTLTGRLKV